MIEIAPAVIKWILLVSVNFNASFLTSDYLLNTYLITDDNALIKADSSGNQLFMYQQNRFGALQFVDATNPLKLILSYPDYGTIVMVDNTLSELGVISLKELGIFNFRAVCFSSRDNNFWVFDEQDYKIKKIDNNGNISVESTDMFQQLNYAIHPVYMQEREQYLYLSDPAHGIFVFDIYGVYYELLPFPDVMKFQIRKDQLFFQKSDTLYSYDLKTLQEKQVLLPTAGEIRDVSIEGNRVYLLTDTSLNVYSF